MPDLGGTTNERLNRIEDTLTNVSLEMGELRDHVSSLQQAEDRRFTDRLLPERVRVLEDQSLRLQVWVGQLRWILAALLGGVFTAIGISLLNLATMR